LTALVKLCVHYSSSPQFRTSDAEFLLFVCLIMVATSVSSQGPKSKAKPSTDRALDTG